MIRKLAKYKVRPDKITEVEKSIQEFVDAIARSEPDTNYTAYRTNEERTYIHLMSFVDEGAEKAHQTAPYTMRFVEILYPNCEEQPRFTDLALFASSHRGDQGFSGPED